MQNFVRLTLIRSLLIFSAALFFGSLSTAHEIEIDRQHATVQPADSAFEGVTVDSISIITHDVFDTDNPKFSSFLYRVSNALHVQTRPYVVRTELLLHVGQPYSYELARETERNIRARLVVFTVTVKPKRLANGRLLVTVETVDQWSLAGGIGFRKEADAVDYDLTVNDRNVFGFNHELGFRYLHPAGKSPFATVSYFTSRLGMLPLALTLEGSSNKEAKGIGGSIAHPYYDRLQRFSFYARGEARNGTASIHYDRDKVAEANIRGSSASGGIFYRTGSLSDKLTFGGFYTYRFEDITDTIILAETEAQERAALNSLPFDTNYHEIGIGAEMRRIEYLQCKRIDRYSVVEDFTLGPIMMAVLNKPVIIIGDDHYRFDFGVGYTGYHGSTLFMVNHLQGYWLEHSLVRRRTKSLTVKVFNNRLPWLTTALNGTFAAIELSSSADLLNLGGFGGLRGYPKYFKSGDRVGVLSSELRFFTGIEILSVAIGSAVFADVGSSWKSKEAVDGHAVYGSIGAGLRFFADRVSGGSAIRMDVVYSERYGTQVSISTGQNVSAKSGEIGLTNR